jgi:hypothetical protein
MRDEVRVSNAGRAHVHCGLASTEKQVSIKGDNTER